MKLAWLTDIHLNFLSPEERNDFYRELLLNNFDAALITGDIAEAPSIIPILEEMVSVLKKKIYFVLGNHDFYKGKIDHVRDRIIASMRQNPLLQGLAYCGPVYLNEDVILMGQDAWADGRYGDYVQSNVVLNDCRMINDLLQANHLGKMSLLDKMQSLADEDAKKLAANLSEVLLKHPKKIIILLHVPPFKENCLYEGKISSDDYLPFFSSKVMGDLLLKTAKEHKDVNFWVLCGHVHSESIYRPLSNLFVESGKAEYSNPEVQRIIEI